MIDTITGADRNHIARAVRDGIRDGKSIKQVAQDILATVKDDQMTAARAKVIATTETNTALSRGAMMAAADQNAIAKAWIVISDNRLCDICEANGRDGIVDMDDHFTSGDTLTPAHPNCRCFIQYYYTKNEIEEAA